MNQSTGTPDSTVWDIFIAHAGPDLGAARQLHDLLENDGWAVFLDEEDLEFGDDWDRALPEAQRQARMTVVLVSENTRDAFYQRAEIAAAINMARKDATKHRVVPVYLGAEGAFPDMVPYGLELKHSIYEHKMGGIEGVSQKISQMTSRIRDDAAARLKERDIAVDLSHQQKEWDFWVDELDRRNFSDRLHIPRSLESPESLDGVSILILPIPFHSEFTQAEIARLRSWVHGGGGLFLLGYYTAGAHHLNNINNLAGIFGMEFCQDLLMPRGSSGQDCRSQVFGGSEYGVRVAISKDVKHPLMEGINELVVQSACSIDTRASSSDIFKVEVNDAEVWTPIGNKSPEGYLRIIQRYEKAPDQIPARTVIAASSYSRGRIVLAGSWKICTVDEADNRRFVDNALEWLAQPNPT